MTVSGRSEPPGQLPKLVTIAERGCIVANTLRAAVELTILGSDV
jgi:putative redox protein